MDYQSDHPKRVQSKHSKCTHCDFLRSLSKRLSGGIKELKKARDREMGKAVSLTQNKQSVVFPLISFFFFSSVLAAGKNLRFSNDVVLAAVLAIIRIVER